MIRKLTEKDRAICFDLVKKKPAENLFIIGDLEAYGFDEDFQEVWGDFTEKGELRAVLLRYNKNFIPYAETDFDVQGFADIINQSTKATQLSGLVNITNALLPHLTRQVKSNRTFFYAKCEEDSKLPTDIDLSKVKKATVSDIERLITLHASIPEFTNTERNPESMRRNMEKGIARTYFIEDGQDLVSSVSTTAENSYAAMVVGVCTDAAYKRKGYATQCLTRLTQEVLSEGKALCLFYDNSEAGSIYKRLGYVDIEKWSWIVLES